MTEKTKKASTKKKDVLEEISSSEQPEAEGQKKGNVSNKVKVQQPEVKTEQNNEEPEEEEVTPEPMVEQPKTFPQSRSDENIGISYQRKAHQMKDVLNKQDKVAFLIPKHDEDPEGAFETVQINGFRIEIKKGVMVNIPRQVAEILAEKYKIQAEVGSEYKIDRNDETEKALS